MKTTILAIIAAIVVTIIYLYLLNKYRRKRRLNFCQELYLKNKSYFEVCRLIGSPLAITKEKGSEIVAVWILDKKRITIRFDAELNFISVTHVGSLAEHIPLLQTLR